MHLAPFEVMPRLVEDAHQVSPREIVDYADYIHKAANLMFDLVTNLLDLNRIEQGKTDLKPCNLWEVVHNIAADYANRAKAKQIKVHFESSSPTPDVLADSGSLGQVVDN